MDLLMKIAVLLLTQLSFVSACGDTFTDLIGALTSPNYTSSMAYPANSDCNWTISTPEGTRIVLTVLEFDVRCGDYIQVTDLSNNTVVPGLDRKCNVLYQKIFMVSNRINIRFVSDGNSQARGFKIAWKVKSNLTWHSDFVSWPEAQAICKRNGGTLIDDVNEYKDDVLKAMQERHVTSIWQGKYITPWVWLKGCFHFDDLVKFQTFARLKENQMTECMRHCNSWNYFGLQRETCFCFDTFSGAPVVTDIYCNETCPGNTSDRCGGNNSLTIYMNDICFKNSSLWKGNVSRTLGGNTCLPWQNITAVTVNSTLVFPDGSAKGASNNCRNPNGSEALWCYVSQDKTEFCDIPPCIDKGQARDFCMQVTKDGYNDLRFTAQSCSTRLPALCSKAGEMDRAANYGYTWKQHREYFWRNFASNCMSLAGPSVFLINRNRLGSSVFYWIGYFRSYSTDTKADLEGNYKQCYTFSNKDGTLGEDVTDCSSKRNFICQTVPVTCGETFDNFSNHSFSTPNYPNGYGGLLHCIWVITVPVNHYMVWGVNVNIETSPSCQYDHLKIYYGSSINGVLNSTLCGSFVKTFNNTQTNITLEFQSDSTENSRGILVTWSMVPITTSTVATSTISSQQDSYKQDNTEKILGLSNGAFAALIVGVIFLLVLSCIVGFLCGTRWRRVTPSKDKRLTHGKGVKKGKNNANKLDSGTAEVSFTNVGFEASPSDVVSKEDGKHFKEEGNDVETDGPLAIYSKVNKPTTNASAAPDTRSPESRLSDKPDNKANQLYNTLNEKHENISANTAVNIYNHLHDTEPTYDDTAIPLGKNNRNKVASDLDMYGHKKQSK